MARITDKNLQDVCNYINKLAGFSPDAQLWVKSDNGQHNATIGMCHIDGAYGGVALYRMTTNGGGVTDVFNRGHCTKRELYDMMQAYILGIESVKFR